MNKSREMWDYVNEKVSYYVEKLAEIKSEQENGCVFVRVYEDEKENDDNYTFLYLDGISDQEKELADDILTDAESEFWNELMKMDLRYFGEIPEGDIVHDILAAATDKFVRKTNGEECHMDIYAVAMRTLVGLNQLGIISMKDRNDADDVLYMMDLESDSGIYKGVTI